jgi:hypothetical protein
MIDTSATFVVGLFAGLAVVLTTASPSASATAPGAPMPGHPDEPPPGHTGGFGEPSCHVCHAEYELDVDGIRVALMGVPEVAEPGSVHRVAVVLQAEGTVKAGFQLATRTSDGRQAGMLRAVDEQVRVTPGPTPAGEVLFAHQTEAGAGETERTETTWTVEWTAPREATEVLWSVSGNSGNGDNSPLGDLVGTGSAGTRVR